VISRSKPHWILGLALVWSLFGQAAIAADDVRIALIIDDVGNQWRMGQRVVALLGPVAVAVLPHTPYSHSLAEDAYASGKEVLVHVPMQASRVQMDPGPGALLLGQSREEFAATLRAAIRSVPHATGLNNHMGSLLTRDPAAMAWLMSDLAEDGSLFFVDSYTTHLSVGFVAAREHSIPALKRDVFLDAEQSPESLRFQWQRLLALARDTGFAVGIAHPHETTIEFLETVLPSLEGVRLVSLRSLIDSHPVQRSYADLIGGAPVEAFINQRAAEAN
jgi:polysaccharide deacetylase 2 family uncharacterized protein YibQ